MNIALMAVLLLKWQCSFWSRTRSFWKI